MGIFKTVGRIFFETPKPSRFLVEEKASVPTHILKFVPFHRAFMLVAAFIVQACFGTVYAWSAFVGGIQAKMKAEGQEAEGKKASNVFQVAMMFNGLFTLLSGYLILRYGPRLVSTGGSLFLILGCLVSGLSMEFNFLPGVFVGSGLFTGIAAGIGNPSSVMALRRYFPDHPSVAVAVAVGGFSVGSFFAFLTSSLLELNIGVSCVFYIYAAVFATLQLPMTQYLRFPPDGYTGSPKQISGQTTENIGETTGDSPISKEFRKVTIEKGLVQKYPKPGLALKNYAFFVLSFAYYGNSVAGLVLIGRIKDLLTVLHAGDIELVAKNNPIAVTLAGVGSFLGRIILGSIAGRLGAVNTYALSCATQIVLLPIMWYSISSSSGGSISIFFCSVLVLGFCFGYSFAGMPVALMQLFSRQWVEILYAMNMGLWSLYSAGSTIYSSFVVPDKEIMLYNMAFAICLLFVGFISSAVLIMFQYRQNREVLRIQINNEIF